MIFSDSTFLFYFLPLSLVLLRVSLGRGTSGHFGILPSLTIFLLTVVFYGFKDGWWLFPFFITVVFDFFWANLIYRSHNPKVRATLLFVSLTQNLGLLAFFKYWKPIRSTLALQFPQWALNLPELTYDGFSISLPPGISFYTFESLSFVIDVYRGEAIPPRGIHHYLAFLGMFPRLIAGPIVRYRQITEQLFRFNGMKIESGLSIFTIGLFFKAVFADSIEIFTQYAFLAAGPMDFVAAWLGVGAYALQLYFDFMGYSLMAIGLGWCLGFEFPINFDRPYRAASIQQFWQRWHMTLSLWVRDYLFLPLALLLGRKITFWIYQTLFLTMLTIGAWHGAGLSCLLMGAWFGLFLCLEQFAPAIKKLGRIYTIPVVLVGWVFLKSETLSQAIVILKNMASPWNIKFHASAMVDNKSATFVLIASIIYIVVIEPRFQPLNIDKVKAWIRVPLLMGIFIAALLLTYGAKIIPFLYFQF